MLYYSVYREGNVDSTILQSIEETQNEIQRLKGQRAEIDYQIERQEYMLNVFLSRSGFPPLKQSLADQIRVYAGKQVERARKRGETEIKFRAGDIHREMSLKNRYPAIASAIQSGKFSASCRVQLIEERGPIGGSNRYLTFKILP